MFRVTMLLITSLLITLPARGQQVPKGFVSFLNAPIEAMCTVPQARQVTRAKTLSMSALRNGVYLSSQAFNLHGISAETQKSMGIFLHEPIAFGDIDGDGKKDAAVVLRTWAGSTGVFRDVALMRNVHGTPKPLATITFGDRDVVNAIDIHNNIISIDATVHQGQDGGCCPSLRVRRNFQWCGERLAFVGESGVINSSSGK